MTAKHTPGPWSLSHVEDGGIRRLVPIDASGTSLLTVVYEGGYDGEETTPFGAVYIDADARLISAAPELLEALILMVRTHDEPAESLLQEMKEQQWIAKARAAIAKATGGAA